MDAFFGMRIERRGGLCAKKRAKKWKVLSLHLSFVLVFVNL